MEAEQIRNLGQIVIYETQVAKITQEVHKCHRNLLYLVVPQVENL